MPIEERREPVHGGLRQLPAADILARHTPHLPIPRRFFGQKGVMKVFNPMMPDDIQNPYDSRHHLGCR